jgi:hypothetical protein
MINEELINKLKETVAIELPEKISMDELREKLIQHINHLISHDFNKLVTILYFVDVNETKLKKLLRENEGEPASEIIADLIIKRQIQKIKSKKEFRKPDKEIDDDEKW